MVNRTTTAQVRVWGQDVGAVSWVDQYGYAVFEFEPSFLHTGIDLSPLHMSLNDARTGDGMFQFPSLNTDTFFGLPGMLADALPDKFGNAVIDAWLVGNGRDISTFNPVERLCYMGCRGMGALEFEPAQPDRFSIPMPVNIPGLIELAQTIIFEREKIGTKLTASDTDNADAIMDILRVGTSAGGARAKAVIAMNHDGDILSGQGIPPKGYDCWILKFDGVSDMELGEPRGYGRIEYAYYLMAKDCGIHMSECRLLEENGRAHFLTKRFDRVDGRKIHMQSLCGMAHFDFNMPGAYSYEQAFRVMRELGLSKADAVQQYRRMLFNIVARNQDDHTKNIAFLMDGDGKWQLAPAFDVTYSHNPSGQWTNQHQMSVGGKRDQFSREDLMQVGRSINLPKPKTVLEQILASVRKWPEFAEQAGIPAKTIKTIAETHRVDLLSID